MYGLALVAVYQEDWRSSILNTQRLLEGQVALVTGGARGIGSACAKALSQVGAAVVIADRLADEAEATAHAIHSAGGKAIVVLVDVTKQDEIAQMVDTARHTFGQVDILVNNAGVLSEVSLEELTKERWDWLMAANLRSVVFVTQALISEMVRRGSGVVVNISSLAARVGGIVAGVDYAASKAGVIGATRTLARQYGPKGIRVNAVAPGPIETEMTRHWSADTRRSFLAQIPLRRLGTPEDVAQVVVFLASPQSSYVTGTTIDVNGGIYMS